MFILQGKNFVSQGRMFILQRRSFILQGRLFVLQGKSFVLYRRNFENPISIFPQQFDEGIYPFVLIMRPSQEI